MMRLLDMLPVKNFGIKPSVVQGAQATCHLHLQELGEGCAPEDVASIQKACAVDPNAPLLEQQFLYNVYNHPAPEFEGGKPLSDPRDLARPTLCLHRAGIRHLCCTNCGAGYPRGHVFFSHVLPDRIPVSDPPCYQHR